MSRQSLVVPHGFKVVEDAYYCKYRVGLLYPATYLYRGKIIFQEIGSINMYSETEIFKVCEDFQEHAERIELLDGFTHYGHSLLREVKAGQRYKGEIFEEDTVIHFNIGGHSKAELVDYMQEFKVEDVSMIDRWLNV